MIERPKKTVDKTRMVRGRPSGVMILAFGSAVDTGIDIFCFSNVTIVRCS
jgi:hypothetical protein